MTDKLHAWTEISRELAFKKYSRAIDKVMFKLPNGDEADFYIKSEAPTVCTLALTKDNKVLLAKQFRPGPQKILQELPGGFIDAGEEPVEAALRELKEETGFTGEPHYVGTCLDDAYSTMVRHCVVVKDCHKVAEPEHTNTEQVELMLVELKDFRDLLKSGQMTDIEVGYLCLDYLGLL
ncbi:MAG TPA: NUDIX hydrolase [Candidatus Microsaccharimonas sp.]|nr:NUDIX hydrolase [Candidatus Microsaccharimonas sp.]